MINAFDFLATSFLVGLVVQCYGMHTYYGAGPMLIVLGSEIILASAAVARTLVHK